jgi:hypothetical protein
MQDRLVEIEALVDTGDFDLILPRDVRWLVDEVKRFREAQRIAQTMEERSLINDNDDLNDEGWQLVEALMKAVSVEATVRGASAEGL